MGNQRNRKGRHLKSHQGLSKSSKSQRIRRERDRKLREENREIENER